MGNITLQGVGDSQEGGGRCTRERRDAPRRKTLKLGTLPLLMKCSDETSVWPSIGTRLTGSHAQLCVETCATSTNTGCVVICLGARPYLACGAWRSLKGRHLLFFPPRLHRLTSSSFRLASTVCPPSFILAAASFCDSSFLYSSAVRAS